MNIDDQLKKSVNLPAADLPIADEPEDFRSSIQWRIFRIMSEFIEGFQFLADFKKTITIFGSARLQPDTHWYQEAQKLGRLLSKAGYGIVTGGGPGIMEAANRGAVEGGKGDSIGLNIQLPNEQRVNPYVKKARGFHYFFSRKVMLSFSAEAYIYFPGGFGTLDEFFEIATLIETRKISPIPIVLVGKDFWSPLTTWIEDDLLKRYKTIKGRDTYIYQVVDSAEEALAIVKKKAKGLPLSQR